VNTSLKREVGLLDGTPEKRIYWSIISDYDLRTGICELLDNAIDMWVAGGRKKHLAIKLELDFDRQILRVLDTAGGVREENLRLLIAPGASSNDPLAPSIGVFGVGSKRAVVALAERVQIRTRYRTQKSYQIDLTTEWLESPDWEIPRFEIPDIAPGVTEIEMSALRKPISASELPNLCEHLAETYAVFLGDDSFQIVVNNQRLEPKHFEHWAYPPEYCPKQIPIELKLPGWGPVHIEITAGLIVDRIPAAENYGVYFYCNNRLVSKEIRSRDVGYFVTSEAGVPHPDASLCRAVVKIIGGARAMPWNSSKSAVNFDHPIFLAISRQLIQVVSHFTSLSRRLKNDWGEKVFKYEDGEVDASGSEDVTAAGRLILPKLPPANKNYIETLKAKNKLQLQEQPWALGLVEAIAAVDVITRQKFETKNRIALILLDSNFEIALKEFIVHRHDLFPPHKTDLQSLFYRRNTVIAAVRKFIPIDQKVVDRVHHYYDFRNKLIHERATMSVGDTDIKNYGNLIKGILKTLFSLKF
jgi:hypothetical protein